MKDQHNNSENKLAKESIFLALMLLMEKKDFEEISITEIAKKAGVSRMAYYRNYNTKEGIINNYLDELFEEYLNEISDFQELDDYLFTYKYFEYCRKHERLFKNLIKSDLQGLILEKFDKYLSSIYEDMLNFDEASELEQKYMVHFIAGGLYKVLIEWVKTGLIESDEKMAEIVCKL